VVDRALPRDFPFGEHIRFEPLCPCHHVHSLLSSRWRDLQSLSGSTLTPYWFGVSALTFSVLTAGLRGLQVDPWRCRSPFIAFLSWSSLRVQSLTRSFLPISPGYCPDPPAVLPGVFGPFDVSPSRAATNTRFASPGCVAPTGSLNLLTPYSAHDLLGLVSCRIRPWVSAFRGFPLPVASRLTTACPLLSFPRPPPQRRYE